MPTLVADTGRIYLRELEVSDAAFMVSLLNSEGWLRYIGDRNVHTTEQGEAYLLNGAIKSYREHGFGLWMIIERETGDSVGLCGLIRRAGLDDVDLGFALMPGKEGRGFAYDAARASVEIAWQRSLPRLVAITTPDNRSSIKLLTKLGFGLQDQVTLPGDTQLLNLYRLDAPAE